MTNMESGTLAASGVKEIDTIQITKELTKMKARKHKFGFYEEDDISQEIWLMVQEASGRYDPTKTNKQMSFFNVHTENRLNNLKRDIRIVDKPTAISTPIISEDNTFADMMEFRDLLDFMIKRIPKNLQDPFDRMLNYGGEGVSQYMKTKVRNVVLRLLERYKDE